MTPGSLFNIILKVFGLFFLRELIITSFQFAASLVYFFQSDTGASIVTLIIYLVVIAFYLFVILQLLFKTNKIIDILRLDQGFNEDELSFDQKKEFDINLSSSVVLTIALIVLAGFILTEEIPNFCKQFYLYFQSKTSRYSTPGPELSYMIVSGLKIIIGLLLLGERKKIVNFIESRQHGNHIEPE